MAAASTEKKKKGTRKTGVCSQGLAAKSCLTLATPGTAAYQAPLSMGFSRQYWSGLPFPAPGDLPDPGIEPGPPALQAGSLSLSHREAPHY